MHTVFVNATKNKIGGRFDSLKNARDLQKLMYVECPLDGWNDEQAGYAAAAREIGEFIDTYNYVNNDFNLIVYVDMVEAFELMQFNYFGADEVEQYMLAKLCTNALTRLVSNTLLEVLTRDGREPAEKPVILLERPKTKAPSSGADHSARYRNLTMKVLHLLEPEKLAEKLTGKESVQIADIVDESYKSARLRLYPAYEDKIQILITRVCQEGASVERACDELTQAMERLYTADCAKHISVSEYYTNKRTLKLSLERYTKHNFLLQSFVLDCINEESAYIQTDTDPRVKKIPELNEQDWEDIKQRLGKKKAAYISERQKILNLDKDFTQLELAPPLYALAREKFGLNESGNVSSEYVVDENAVPEVKDSGAESLRDQQTVLTEKTGVIQNWFDKKDFTLYDSAGDAYTADMSNATAQEYCDRARKLANHHLNIFNKLNMHVKRAMANYSSRSLTNAKPVLRKRSVNTGEPVQDSAKNDYKYAKTGGTGYEKEKDPAETVIETSKQAYVTVMLEYLKFDAGRGIAMRNIKEQCEWFMDRIRQIEESLRKLTWILLLLSVGLFAVYLPFVLIQWESITRSVETILVALPSLLVPYALLVIFYFIAAAMQKKKMKIAWKELVAQSEASCAANKQSIESYDAMMTRYIPALRWLYEYVLDVDFHCDCCDIARAKLAHHREKLFEQIESLGNFLEDLDCDEPYVVPQSTVAAVEYANAFCEGEKNTDFYSVIDKELLSTLYKREGGGLQ